MGCGGDVTADDFADSLCPSGTVTIPSGETSATFAVSTNDDSAVENAEEFEVTLTGVSPDLGGRITISGTMDSASVTIDANDAESEVVEIGFSPVNYRVPERAGSVTLTVGGIVR